MKNARASLYKALQKPSAKQWRWGHWVPFTVEFSFGLCLEFHSKPLSTHAPSSSLLSLIILLLDPMDYYANEWSPLVHYTEYVSPFHGQLAVPSFLFGTLALHFLSCNYLACPSLPSSRPLARKSTSIVLSCRQHSTSEKGFTRMWVYLVLSGWEWDLLKEKNEINFLCQVCNIGYLPLIFLQGSAFENCELKTM
jgi:hypothetical protein